MTDPDSATLDAARACFMRGLAAHQAGDLAQAERAFRDALALAPDRPSVLTNLGVVLLQSQRFDEAEAVLRRRAVVERNSVESLLALGDCLALAGKHDAALASFTEAAAQRPGDALALARVGRELQALGRSDEALAHFERALAVEPDNLMLLISRGDILYRQGRHAAAADCYESVLRLDANHLEALNGAVAALAALARHEAALAHAEHASALAPDNAQILCNHGNVLADLRRYPESLTKLDQALRLQPQNLPALCNRAVVLIRLSRHDEAAASLAAALAIAPDHAHARMDLARVMLLKKDPAQALAVLDAAPAPFPEPELAGAIRGDALLALGRAEEALAAFDRALAHAPGNADLLNSRCNALLLLGQPQALIEGYQRLLQAAPDYDYAPGCLLHAQLNCCDWRDFDEQVRQVRAAVDAGRRADLPFTFLAVSDSPAAQLQCARLHAAHDYAACAGPVWQGEIYRHDKIRIAYLSADFHEHATAHLMAGLFEAHDAARFEVTAISFGPETGDAMRGRLKRAFTRFIDARQLGDAEVAARMRALEIDIAVDLKGYTQHHRAGILARRAAPIQVNYLGYPGTMGADFIDYLIADPVVIPPADRVHYAEQVVYLPHSYQVNDRARAIAPLTLSRSTAGLPQDGIVFCCFNNHYKITPAVFQGWMRLLHKVDGSVLWLLAGPAVVTNNLRLAAQHEGIAPARLVFAPRLALADHLARHQLADIFLDTRPYNAHTTASDALWAGLPVVTCAGHTFAGRVAASLLTAAQMPDLVCDTPEAYEALALALATDRRLLAETRARLAARRAVCPLFDTNRYCRHLEMAYTLMWRHYQGGVPPQPITITAGEPAAG